jgi:DNA polymerase III epsilon subunit-like protein
MVVGLARRAVSVDDTPYQRSEFTMSELHVTAQIMRHWFGPHAAGVTPPKWNSYPDDYFVADTETTGVKPAEDLILEFGWHMTRGRKTADNASILINWIGHFGITYEFIKERTDRLRQIMAEKGANYRYTPEMLIEHGMPAPEAIEQIYGIFMETLDRGEMIVGHNIIGYDRAMFDAMFNRFFDGKVIPWPADAMFDTGLVEKASRQNRVPWEGDTIHAWARRAAAPPWNVKWSLDAVCIPKYRLADRFGLQPDLAHTAAFDCLVTHKLFETYREIGEGVYQG